MFFLHVEDISALYEHIHSAFFIYIYIYHLHITHLFAISNIINDTWVCLPATVLRILVDSYIVDK